MAPPGPGRGRFSVAFVGLVQRALAGPVPAAVAAPRSPSGAIAVLLLRESTATVRVTGDAVFKPCAACQIAHRSMVRRGVRARRWPKRPVREDSGTRPEAPRRLAWFRAAGARRTGRTIARRLKEGSSDKGGTTARGQVSLAWCGRNCDVVVVVAAAGSLAGARQTFAMFRRQGAERGC